MRCIKIPTYKNWMKAHPACVIISRDPGEDVDDLGPTELNVPTSQLFGGTIGATTINSAPRCLSEHLEEARSIISLRRECLIPIVFCQ